MRAENNLDKYLAKLAGALSFLKAKKPFDFDEHFLFDKHLSRTELESRIQ